jgi:hypothetical protein
LLQKLFPVLSGFCIESFIYPIDAQLDGSKNVKIYITIYMRGAPTCFGFSQPSSGSYYMCFVKVISINNQLKYVGLCLFPSSTTEVNEFEITVLQEQTNGSNYTS